MSLVSRDHSPYESSRCPWEKSQLAGLVVEDEAVTGMEVLKE
jgi:hypothetical protein